MTPAQVQMVEELLSGRWARQLPEHWRRFLEAWRDGNQPGVPLSESWPAPQLRLMYREIVGWRQPSQQNTSPQQPGTGSAVSAGS